MKLIATDLDGTLLNENGEISIENATAIKKAIDAGIQVVVATGRSYSAANKPLQQVGLNCPIICLNGANVYTENGERLSNIPLSKSISKKILHQCQVNNTYFELYTNQGIYSPDRAKFMDVLLNIMLSANPDITREEVEERAALRFQEEEFKITDDFEGLLADENIEVFKALAFCLEADTLEKVKTPFTDADNVVITSSGFDNLEFNHPEAQKGIALSIFAAEKGIALKDTMALGDNYNDLSMLKIVGRGVAMGNAEEGIKATCDYHTVTNNEHGVAKAIEAIL
ncbi:haloacid dehalogenase [Paraliobacillus quinghaiensis]|uniref:Haloacid dehalogenase n=1 Tax=Paraliobacillus quinghaiensis TaxID=470815 RepID=A0A917TDG1_9BACI|nr:Cof-type HAD-IIB family hydrolase [Paraliobacillus quinghaiensis]GGM19452.1 haloacid dehalogenase [Paraliobacillus quinghaiensis]